MWKNEVQEPVWKKHQILMKIKWPNEKLGKGAASISLDASFNLRGFSGSCFCTVFGRQKAWKIMKIRPFFTPGPDFCRISPVFWPSEKSLKFECFSRCIFSVTFSFFADLSSIFVAFGSPGFVLDLVSKLVGRKAHFFGKLDAFLLQLVRALSQASRFMLFYLR